jgi:hypothetical protein
MWWLFKKDNKPFVPEKPALQGPEGLPKLLDSAWIVRVLKDKE